MTRRRTTLLALAGLSTGLLAAAGPGGAAAGEPVPVPVPVEAPLAVGTGGAVATVDPEATRVGLQVLRPRPGLRWAAPARQPSRVVMSIDPRMLRATGHPSAWTASTRCTFSASSSATSSPV